MHFDHSGCVHGCSELLAKERNDLYWRFLEQWLETGESAKLHTDKECVRHIEEKGSSLLGAPLSPLFRLSLSLRSASPKLVLYRQLATESLALYEKVMLCISAALLLSHLTPFVPAAEMVFSCLLIWQLKFPVMDFHAYKQFKSIIFVVICNIYGGLHSN